MKKKYLLTILIALYSSFVFADLINCKEAYPNQGNAQCEQVTCDEKHQSFLDTWTGPMESHVDLNAEPIYRKYRNTISYSPSDCFKNLDSGKTFIIGR